MSFLSFRLRVYKRYSNGVERSSVSLAGRQESGRKITKRPCGLENTVK